MSAAEGFEIRLSGTGGQGLGLAGKMLGAALSSDGLHVAQSQSYEPTSRGGMSRSDLVVSRGMADYPLATALDYLLILDQRAVAISEGMVKESALVIIDEELVPEPPLGKFDVRPLPLAQTALGLGNLRVTNVVSLGAIVALTGICSLETLEAAIQRNTPKKYAQMNLDAVRAGFELVCHTSAEAESA
ncbi:MAG: 2-oxoacid:acceptor oxidoreductase family protein [Lysobacterales bacterium]|jgi:2-oxoglutarate ferredoxin oxidoreductase subunit gamma